MTEQKRVRKLRLGEILIKEKLISVENLKDILDLQKKEKNYMPLGELLISKGIINRNQLTEVLKKYRNGIQFGELLLNMGLLTSDQLVEALAHQKKTGQKIGQILVEMEVITEMALVDTLSIQLGIPKIIPIVNLINKKALEKFNPDFLYDRQFIPAFKEKDTLTVIMADPLNIDTIDFLSQVLKCKISPAIAPAGEIKKTIRLYYQKMEMGQELAADKNEIDLVIGNNDFIKSEKDDIIEILNFIISTAIVERASDIHIEPQDHLLRIRYRIDGIMYHKTDLPNHIIAKLINRIKAICGLDLAEKRHHQDGRIQARVMGKEYDLRVSTYVAIWGENIVIRIQSRSGSIVDIKKIGFSPANLAKYMSMLDHPAGIILVTGPTGSGKTTTLYASLQYLNKMDRVIVTVEEPVEYTIEGVVQATLPPKVDINYMDYIKAMMRQDPDVLMIGEIRDPEAADAVIQASLTGHKVLSTFHTEDATGALLRLMDMGIETFLISSTLVSVVAQRLLRVLCERCKEPAVPSAKTVAFFSSITKELISRYTFYKPKGCVHCSHTGYKGMTAIHEVLLVNNAIRDEILKRSTSTKIKSIARQSAGLLTMSEDGFYKALKGITTLDEVIRVVFRDESEGLVPITIESLVERSEAQPVLQD